MESRKDEVRLLDINEFMRYTGLGRNSALAFAKKYNLALRPYGRRVLYDRVKIDRVLDHMTERANDTAMEG